MKSVKSDVIIIGRLTKDIEFKSAIETGTTFDKCIFELDVLSCRKDKKTSLNKYKAQVSAYGDAAHEMKNYKLGDVVAMNGDINDGNRIAAYSVISNPSKNKLTASQYRKHTQKETNGLSNR